MTISWPTPRMLEFARRVVPWAEARIMDETSSGFPALRKIPGSRAESWIKVFDRIGPSKARDYMTQRLRSSYALIAPDIGRDYDSEFLETTLREILDVSALLVATRPKGFAKKRFIALLPNAFHASGHTGETAFRDLHSAKWISGRIEVQTELVVGRRISYSHSVKVGGEIACVQISLAGWLGLQGDTVYEPGPEHSPEVILNHLTTHWRVFLDAVPGLVG